MLISACSPIVDIPESKVYLDLILSLSLSQAKASWCSCLINYLNDPNTNNLIERKG